MLTEKHEVMNYTYALKLLCNLIQFDFLPCTQNKKSYYRKGSIKEISYGSMIDAHIYLTFTESHY